jgi:hypothetical protein
VSESPRFDPEKILGVLERHEVDYVVIGGLAAFLRGSPYPTDDVDITPRRDRANFGRLAAALRELDAKLRVPDLPEPLEIPLDEWSFDQGTTWTFWTSAGRLDLSLLPDGTRGYADLARGATREPIAEGLSVAVASLKDVIRSKQAADREKDRRVLPELRRVLERSRRSR